ncbi:MAG: hypothetical protein IID41_03385 [Planctomycetes bacterium]|nr:hypothetical protein [Planctomycetota bacterium]
MNARVRCEETAYPCTSAKRGVWTLLWRYELVRDQIEALGSEPLPAETAESVSSRSAERRLAMEELQRLRVLLEGNGVM